MERLGGKVALVAGGATGIGAATSRRLAEEGAAVLIGDVALEPAKATAEALTAEGHRAAAVRMDLLDESSVRDAVAAAVSTFGGLDLLDNNAADTSPQAMSGDLDVVTTDLALWDRIIDVNLRGFVLTCRYAVPAMLERGGGAIVNIASGSGISGEPDHVAYGCSKAGVIQLVRHLAARWGKQGIRANAIAPGLIVTEKVAKLGPVFDGFAGTIDARTCVTRLGRPEDIAATVAFLLSDDAAYITGQLIQVDGGMFVRGGAGVAEATVSSDGFVAAGDQN